MSDHIPPEEVDKWLNFQLISKPEQSGKTFIMIAQIVKEFAVPKKDKVTVNFIFCDNNLLLTKQTSGRLQSDVKTGVQEALSLKKAFAHWKAMIGRTEEVDAEEVKRLAEFIVDGVAYIEMSSHERTEFHNVPAVYQAIVGDGVMNIVCCANAKRMADIAKLIDDINRGWLTKGRFHFNIWLDEADKFIKFIDATLRPTVNKYSNVDCKLITATSQPLFKKYKYMNVLPILDTTREDYHGWDDNIIRIIDHDGDCAKFAEHVLSKVIGKLAPGTKLFIPGKRTKKSHDEIRKLCMKKGIAVICVNGDGVKLTLPYTCESTMYPKDDDLNSMLLKIYEARNLARFPLAITGYICIGRGITIMSQEFIIDYAILSHYSDKNEASQLAGRTKGNIKGFKNYKQPTVFTTEEFDAIAREWESKSRELGRMALEKEQSGEGTIVSVSELFPKGNSTVPVKLIMDSEIRDEIIACSDKIRLHDLLKEKYIEGKIRLEDRNSLHLFTNDKRDKTGRTTLFDDIHKKISSVRCYKEGHDKSSRRFKQFDEAFQHYVHSSQKGKVGEYSIDFAADPYEYDGFVHDVNIAWITFKHK